MAIIAEYEEDSEEVGPEVQPNENAPFGDEDDDDLGDGEDYPSVTTSNERPHNEVLTFLLRQHQQQPLDVLSTVIDFLYRETGIAAQAGVDARVSEMLLMSAARRRRADADDTEDVLGGPDRVAQLDEIFEEKSHIIGPQCVASSKNKSVQDQETVIITPTEYPDADVYEDNSKASSDMHANDDDDHYFEADTTIITPREDVPLMSNLALNPEDEKVDEKCIKPKDLDPNCGNGADLEKYSWTQTLYDTTLLIPVPMGTNAKSITCDIQPRYLKVGLKGEAPLLEGDLNKPVKPSECFWNLEDGKLLAVHLQKHYTMDWWHVVLEGEPEIDVTKVNLPQASLSDLHPDTRRHIEHVLFDQQEAAKEMPKSDELHKGDALRKFMSESLELYA